MSQPTSLCYILQNKFVGLVPSQPTNLSAGSWRFLFKELGYENLTPWRDLNPEGYVQEVAAMTTMPRAHYIYNS
jgi:hypothetical protein